jgi:isoquinoline 1-oxidoreductase alpha subunit
MVTFTVNGTPRQLEVEADMPLLWALRDELGLTGTKYGCGIAACGACTVLVDGVATRSCSVPAASLEGAAIVTIEGLKSGDTLHKIQQAWIDAQAPQCGYCQSGQIMAAADLLARIPQPSDADIDAAMTNICRCGSYAEIRAAIHRAAATA